MVYKIYIHGLEKKKVAESFCTNSKKIYSGKTKKEKEFLKILSRPPKVKK